VKFHRYSANDVVESLSANQFGIDSNPIEGINCVYDKTEDSTGVITGCINGSTEAQPGETRLYSMDASGNLKAIGWLHADGTIVFNYTTMTLKGTADNPVRYIPLNTALQAAITTINTNFSNIATAIATVAAAAGLPPTPPQYTPTAVSLDISAAKINDIKTT
jgi:hypothetical protein